MQDVAAYIQSFSGDTKNRLLKMREIIQTEVPDAEEGIMYGLVGYKFHGKPLVYFGGFEHHVGFYATPQTHETFATELASYKQGKGSVQFPHSQTLPVDLIAKMVQRKKQELEA